MSPIRVRWPVVGQLCNWTTAGAVVGLSCIVSRGVYARDNGDQAIFSSTGCADVPFGAANVVDVQIAFGSASPTTTCQYAEMIVPRDVAAF